jgi:hypothetical protein
MQNINRRKFIQQSTLVGMGLLIQTKGFAQDFPSVRVSVDKRNFSSLAIEATISRMKTQIKDPELAWLFENCFPNTLDTTVYFKKKGERPDTFVITGDGGACGLFDHEVAKPGKEERYAEFFAALDRKRGDVLVGFGWMTVEKLLELNAKS